MQWHAVRQWDRLPRAAIAAAIARGWRRNAIQEGETGNGLEFLAMHRAMLELLREQFPAHAAHIAGWSAMPTNPADPNDPVPPLQAQVFDADKLLAVALFQSTPGFASADDGFEPTAPFVLEAFSESQVKWFLEIEKPAHGPIPDDLAAVPNFPTIGDFYAALLAGLTSLDPAPTFDTAHQLEADLIPHTPFAIRNLADARRAIQTIVEQGEGTPQSQGSDGPTGPQLAHYYAFNQMLRRMMYTRRADGF